MRNIIAALINLIIIVLELKTFAAVKNKLNILKFYTFLQNFIALVTSAVFLVFCCIGLYAGRAVPVWVEGLRYTATCGLAATMFVFAAILAPRFKSGKASHGTDLFAGLNPARANIVLHFVCPLLSIASYVFAEGTPALSYKWTSYAAWPSIIYWGIYIFLTLTHLWTEPYGLTGQRRQSDNKKDKWKKRISAVLLLMCIPAAFIVLEYLLIWLNLSFSSLIS